MHPEQGKSVLEKLNPNGNERNGNGNGNSFTLIPTFRRTAKIERQNTRESISYDVTNRNIALLQ